MLLNLIIVNYEHNQSFILLSKNNNLKDKDELKYGQSKNTEKMKIYMNKDAEYKFLKTLYFNIHAVYLTSTHFSSVS